MQSRWFWSNWLKDLRWIWYLSACLFIVSFIFLWINYFQGASGVIHWESIQEQKVLESTVHTFRAGPFELSVPAENYVLLEYFNGSNLEINIFTSLFFVTVIALSIVLLLTVITTVTRFWYFAGMALFILFIISLRLEVLNIFGHRNQLPTIALLAVFILPSYYFHSINPAVSFSKRLLAFLSLAICCALIIHFFSEVPYPMLHLSVTAYSSGLIFSIIFILMVAHEIPAAFVYIASQGNSKSLRHFTIISVIYILNVIITCLHEIDVIHWNFIYINIYLLLSISAILGLWGFRLRENLYANIFSFAPYGAYLFIALGTICFVTIMQLLGTANDPALRIVRDVIIFSHTGYGVIFLTYVFSNFIVMLEQNKPVHKILYKPNRMPYFSFRLAGLIMTLAFIFYSSWRLYIYNGIAGFYNNIGDLYELLDRSATAEAYYEQGRNYGFLNNHSNYALAKLKSARYNFDAARENYDRANGKRPTAFSLVNEGNLYVWENKFFDAIHAFKVGVEKNPESGEIQNNLGFAYGKIHNLDSALVYLNDARNHSHSKSSAEANFFALAALEYLPINGDSVLKIFDNPYKGTLSNALALTTSLQQKFTTKLEPLADKKLDIYSATLLNNFIINQAKLLDTTFVNQADKIISDSLNSNYAEALKSSLAFAYYHQGNVSKALQVLSELVYLSQSYQGKFNYIMGLWALEQHNATLAASYFNYAVDANYKEAKLYKAIALTEAGNVNEALIAWDTVSRSKVESENSIAVKMNRILTIPVNEVQVLNDEDKYQFCRYRFQVKDTILFDGVVSSFKNDNYKAQALLDMTEKLFEYDNLPLAILYFNRIGGLKLTDKVLYDNVQHMELRMLAERKEIKKLANQINKNIVFGPGRNLEKMYYTALLNEASNDTLHATLNYAIIGTYNPYFEEGIIAAATYFKNHGKNKMKPYTLLAEAIQVNNNSIRLLNAYSAEALRMGFDEYAMSSLQRIQELKKGTAY